MFAEIDTPRLKLIAFASERVVFAAGQIVFHQGGSPDAAYIVLDGETDALLETPAGRIALSRLGPNCIIGEMGVITGAPRSATVIAATDTTALRVPREVLLGLLAEFPQMALALMRDQIRRIVSAEARLAEATQGKEPVVVRPVGVEGE
ncbi:MAG: cyclic nucleotide-binding domain-containing protein [Methylobacteriaceae bacterium]|nr:cyclic nucleotide-binding domain-containing protein [Methylobacteriaceae bacterium]